MMSNSQIDYLFQDIRQQLAELRGINTERWEQVNAALENLQVTYEQMQLNLDAMEVVEEEFFRQKQHYQDLFQFSPIPCMLTNADGLILEANQAIGNLLNLPHIYLVGKPLAIYVAQGDRPSFRTRLQQLAHSTGTQVWQLNLCPRNRQPVEAALHVATVRHPNGSIESLRIGVCNLSQVQLTVAHSTDQPVSAVRPRQKIPVPQLPQSLDGLRVLVVDDDADACEFIVTLLASHGISARAVASAAAALAALEQFRPDVLLSDIRLPEGDGYRLIQQIRTLEAQQGGHLPAAAMTAYLEEDQEKSLKAGFERHLYKLAQPSEWIKLVAELAEQSSSYRCSM